MKITAFNTLYLYSESLLSLSSLESEENSGKFVTPMQNKEREWGN